MKKLLLALLATTVVAAAGPALAHDDDDDGDWGAPSYQVFDQQYHHIWDGIQHGLSDGSFTPRQAGYFFRELQNIRARADWEERRGYYDPDDIEARLEALHDRMHVAHDRGHERLDNDWNGYGSRGFGYYGYYGR
jgi:hypothetical protein